MGKSDAEPSNPTKFIPKEKYNTEIYLRDKYKTNQNYYNTTPNDKYKRNNVSEQRVTNHFDYLKHNLFIKSRVGTDCAEWQFQQQKISFRNYTPKILNQEVNMGMWIFRKECEGQSRR